MLDQAPGVERRRVRIPSTWTSRTWTPVTLTPLALPEGVLVLRSPTLADGRAWSAARLANREWLERAFPAWNGDWEAEQSEVAWAQRWWRLRWSAISGRSKPFVMTLDGVLMGECGVDAIDVVSGAGEASNWKVRTHGSPAVMNAASLLLLEHAFTGPDPVARMVGPVATTSRQGRAPGLRAIGFEIEATVPRKVGSKGLVDHDIWVLHNTAESRRTVAEALRPLRAAPLPHGWRPAGDTPVASTRRPRGALVAVAGRAAVREARAGVRHAAAAVAGRRADAATTRTVSSAGGPVSMRPAGRREVDAVGGFRTIPADTERWAASGAGGSVVVGHRSDPGTATTEVFAAARAGTSRDLVEAVLAAVIDDVRPATDEQRLVVLRVPAGADGTGPDAALLTQLGLDRIATYSGDPSGPHGWGGEDLWRVPASE